MTSSEIHKNVEQIISGFSKDEFIYDLLLAYGISKTSITRLKKGDFNLSKNEGEVLYKRKIFFKVEKSTQLLVSIERIAKDESILRHNPRFAILTDYETLVAKDLKLGNNLDIALKELPDHYDFFLPLAGAEAYHVSNDNEADRNAAYKMGELYDVLVEENELVFTDEKSAHNLNLFLSRLLFCFFAEDTGIFEENIFTNTLAQHTQANGSDIQAFLDRLFKKLDAEKPEGFPGYLAKFPYVNGGLFGSTIPVPKFNTKARKILLSLSELDWKNINPDIFGSMIQAVVRNVDDDNTKHYTSVANILKVIKPLFLDELEAEYEKAKDSVKPLRKLINSIANIKFFDPACGSGNFLIITYKEIRLLEIKILQRIIELTPNPALEFTQIQLSQFYGIELDDFAHEIAILSLWLAEHQMNLVFDDKLAGYGQSKPILPLKQAGKIVRDNAARLDWKAICPIDGDEEVYVLGNPPYDGARKQSASQKEDMSIVFNGIKGFNNMDYIAIWFLKAKQYILGKHSQAAFVSTNSICQGQQVALIWPHLSSGNIEIGFAYPSFKWTNNAKGNAGVTVVIVGLRNVCSDPKYLIKEGFKKEAKNINPYLLDTANVFVSGQNKPISNFPEISFGNMANDGGNLLLSSNEKNDLLSKEPKAEKYIKKLVGALEFIRGVDKYCLWIEDEDLRHAMSLPKVAERISKTKKSRENSKRKATQKLSAIPHKFAEIRYQPTDAIIVPSVSSEQRHYIPIGYLNPDKIIVAPNFAIYHAQPWHFAVITSRMHMVWVRAVGGKLKTDYRYSAKLCYNTFPFPEISIKQKETLSQYVFDILDARAKHPGKTMAQLYDPDKMPQNLREAHQALDKAVEQCYRLQPFNSDTRRLEYLFKLYEEMVKQDTLFAKQKKKRKKNKKTK